MDWFPCHSHHMIPLSKVARCLPSLDCFYPVSFSLYFFVSMSLGWCKYISCFLNFCIKCHMMCVTWQAEVHRNSIMSFDHGFNASWIVHNYRNILDTLSLFHILLLFFILKWTRVCKSWNQGMLISNWPRNQYSSILPNPIQNNCSLTGRALCLRVCHRKNIDKTSENS